MSNHRVGVILWATILLFSIGATVTSAQEITGTIIGVVRDKTGAVVPGATVTVTNNATGEARRVTTEDNGLYTVSSLTVGKYDIKVEKEGFRNYLDQQVELHVNEKLEVDVTLEVGRPEESVTVTAEASKVETGSNQLDTLITGPMIRELPLSDRNFAQLTQLAPGISSSLSSDPGFGGLTSLSISAGGGRVTAINWSIDGTRNVDTGSNQTLFNYPSVDAIAEFNVITNSYDAEFGRNSGGIINVVTRSGGKDLHGGVYEFFRNDVLQARDPFINTPIGGISPDVCFNEADPSSDSRCRFKGPYRYNNFGWNLGGPVYIPHVYGKGRDKTFFFFSQEFRRIRQALTQTGTYPTADQRAGIFDHQIIDPSTGQPFANNRIPVGMIDANAAAIVQHFMPLPNSPSAGPNVFTTAAPAPTNFHEELIRIDHSFNDKVKLWGRYIHDNTSTVDIGGLFNGLTFPGVADTATNTPADNVLVTLLTVIKPNLLNEVSYDLARNAITSNIIGNGLRAKFPDIKIPEVFPGSPGGTLPAINIDGFSSPLGFFGPFANDNPSHEFTDNLTYTRGKHTFKAGVQIHLESKNEDAGGGFTAGSFNFTGNFTGDPLADFLLGLATQYQEDQVDVRTHYRYNSYEWYVQDSWKVLDNLTLNLGLRHSVFLQPIDTNNILASFLPRFYNPAKAVSLNPADGTIVAGSGNLFNGVIFAGMNSPYGRNVQTNNYDNLGPRIGLAWDPFADGKMSVRAGFGVYYDRTQIGFIQDNGFNDPLANTRITINNTFLSNPQGAAPDNSLFPIQLTTTGDPYKTPTTIQWSLSIQREFGKGIVAEAAYAGSESYHLVHQVNINQPALNAFLNAPNIGGSPDLDFVRPYRGFSDIFSRETTATSSYNSLQLSLRKEFSNGQMIFANYTFAKTLTTASDDRGDLSENSYNYALDRGPANFQRRHVFNLSYVLEIPFPKNTSSLLRTAFGGWQVGGSTFFWSGLPLTIIQAGDLLNVAGADLAGDTSGNAGNIRPNLIANPRGPRNSNEWFNVDAFSAATTNFGTAPRGVITGPGVNNWDISFVKNFTWRDNVKLRFSADFINAFNHTNLGTPDTTAVFTETSPGVFQQTNTDFGHITDVGRNPRIIQLGLKLNF